MTNSGDQWLVIGNNGKQWLVVGNSGEPCAMRICFYSSITVCLTCTFVLVACRYFLRATISRRLSDITKEMDIVVYTLCTYPELNSSIKMEVGIEDCLHIEFEYNKSKYEPHFPSHISLYHIIFLQQAIAANIFNWWSGYWEIHFYLSCVDITWKMWSWGRSTSFSWG